MCIAGHNAVVDDDDSSVDLVTPLAGHCLHRVDLLDDGAHLWLDRRGECCSVLQCVALCCTALKCGAVRIPFSSIYSMIALCCGWTRTGVGVACRGGCMSRRVHVEEGAC